MNAFSIRRLLPPSGILAAAALLIFTACEDERPGPLEVDPSYDLGADGVDPGSHFRYATLSWAPTGTTNEVQIRLVAAFRLNANLPCDGGCTGPEVLRDPSLPEGPTRITPAVGDVFRDFQGSTRLNFGDGVTSTLIRFVATAVDVSAEDPLDHWVVGEALDPLTSAPGMSHTYPDPGLDPGPFTAFLPACCRIGQSGLPTVVLQNRPGSTYPVSTSVDLSGNSSPTSSMVPIVSVPTGVVNFLVPAADTDGDALTFRLATLAEVGNGSGDLHPPGLEINSATGLVTWDNRSLSSPTLWTTQVMVEDAQTKTPVDFLLRITGSLIGSAPTCTAPAGPITGAVGTLLDFAVSAADADGDVTLNTAALPPGAVMTPGLPSTGSSPSSTFTWTPAAGQEGTFVVLFSATDTDHQTGLCSTTIQVNIIDEGGGTVPVVDESGDPAGVVIVPEGAFASAVVIKAELVPASECLVESDASVGSCLQITIPSGTTIEPGFFVTIGLCVDNPALFPTFAIFRSDEDGTVVLQNVEVELDCGDTTASLPSTRLGRWALGLWNAATSPFRPKVAYARAYFANRGIGGLTGSFSDFLWVDQTRVSRASFKGTPFDRFEARGTLLDPSFDPATEDVVVQLGECEDIGDCPGRFRQEISGSDFVLITGEESTKLEFKLPDSSIGVTRVEIREDGRFKVEVRNTDFSDLSSLDADEPYVSFVLEIGSRIEATGLFIDEEGHYKFGDELTPGVEDLISDIKVLGLDAKDEKKLVGDLEKALEDLGKGNTKSAAQILDSFLNQINRLVRSGALTALKAEDVIDDAEFLLDIIENP